MVKQFFHWSSIQNPSSKTSKIQNLLAAGLVLMIAAACSAADAPAPIHAYIGTKVALARSGPGLEHYATDALALGDLVEVLDHENGWAAIDPPLDAYSWVPAAKLRILSDSDAEVIADNVKAWLGSDVEEVQKHAYQVQLRRGEHVEITGRKEVAAAAGAAEVWVKIRPPMGERRWVRDSELRDSPPLGAARSRSATQRTALTADEDGWTDRRSKTGSSSALTDDMPPLRADHNPSRASFINARDRLAHFADEVARLQLAISQAAATTANSKQVDDLHQEIKALVDAGHTPLERAEASKLLESADELLELAEKREELGLDVAAMQPVSSTEKRDDPAVASPFRVKGWLMPVAYNGRRTDMCAIMNDEHIPIAFVTPAPGINLRRYVNKEVGIVGEDGVQKEIRNLPHVVAHRVVELSRHRDAKPSDFAKAPWIRFGEPAEELQAPNVVVE